MLDPIFPVLPAPEDFSPLQLTVEIHESLVEALEHAADLRQLLEVAVDLARDVLDAAAQRELLGRFAPVGPRPGRDDFVLRDQIAPLGMQRDQVGDDAPDEGKRTIGFGEGEVFWGQWQFLFPNYYDALNEFRVRDKPDYPPVPVHHYNRRSDVRVLLI